MDIDTAPAAHHDSRPPMQLDIPSPDEVMMEVDPEVSVPSTPSTPNQDGPSVPSQPSNSLPHALLSSWFHSNHSPRSLDCPSSPLRVLPVPPVGTIASSDVAPWPKLKLDQLFVEWFARPESQTWLTSFLDDTHTANVKPSILNQIDFLHPSTRFDRSPTPGRSRSPPSMHANASCTSQAPQQAPGSPVSRLFRAHEPFGDSDSSPRSPPAAMSSIHSSLKPNVTTHTMSAMDLGSSGSVSPLTSDSQSTPVLSAVHRVNSETLSVNHLDASSKRNIPDNTVCANTWNRPSAPLMSHSNADSRAVKNNAGEYADVTVATDLSLVRNDGTVASSEVAAQSKVPGCTSDTGLSEMDCTSSCPLSKAATSPAECESSGLEKRGLERSSIRGEGKLEEKTTGKDSLSVLESHGVASSPFAKGCMNESDGTKILQGPELTPRGSGMSSDASPLIGSRPCAMEESTSPSCLTRPGRQALPEFYFPCGRDVDMRERKEREAMKEFFKVHRAQKKQSGVSRTDIAELVVESVGLPSFFATIVYSLVMDLFPRGSTDAPTSAYPESMDNRLRRSGEDSMKDLSGGGERSSSSSVSVMDRSMGVEEDWRGNADTMMGDANDAGGGVERSNGDAMGLGRATGDGDASPTVDSSHELLTEEQMEAFYAARCAGFSREARMFNALLGPSLDRNFLVPSDFKPVMRALLLCHRGLAFLHSTPEFQQRYSETVIERIYFGCTRQHNGRLTLADVRRSKLLDTLMAVDEEEDINRERRYFSYEHFYVLYCRFWELDANHDLQIDKEDLMRYGSHSLTTRIVDRIFSGHARPLDAPQNGGYMSYTDFIWFCLSEEDKTSDTAIDYWFRCVDMDGDGLITMYDMEYFYTEQLHRMESFGHEPVQIKDILCQLLDMINPNMHPPVIRRRDLKRCRLAGNFFNVLFNLNKFFAIEARDPLQIRQEHATPELTDWDRFAALEYLRLSADEEGEEDESWEEVGEAANPLMAGEAPF